MQKIDLKLNFSTILGILFFVLIFFAILFKDSVFGFIDSQGNPDAIANSQKVAKDTADLLLAVENISLDTSILSNPYLQNLTRLPDFPIDAKTLSNFGKANLFLGGFIVVPDTATSSVGGVVYSNQRELNNGNSLRPVRPTTTTRTTNQR